jgi:hypothetical protein
MPDIFREIGEFLKSVCLRWVNAVGGSLIGFYQIWCSASGKEPPVRIYWLILGVCLTIAIFSAWRDEYRKSRSESLYSIVSKIVDLVPTYHSMRVFPSPPKHDLLGALIHYADQVRSEKDVVRICRRLEELDHGDPFQVMYLIFKPKSLRRKKLKFIRDAHQSGRDLRLDIKIVDYARTWAEKNGIQKHCFPKPSS